MSSLVAQYNAICAYICNEITILGASYPDLPATRQSQLNHMMSLISKSAPGVMEAAALQQALQVETPAFSYEQRQSIGANLSRVMRNTPTLRTSIMHKTQKHKFMFNYLTESDWAVLLDTRSYTHEDCQRVVATRGLKIGLVFPCPLTFVSMNSIIQVARKTRCTPKQSYDQQTEFKSHWTVKRLCSAYAQTVTTFASDVGDFIAQYPNAYDPADPPVASRVTILECVERAAENPCRTNNAKLMRFNSKQSQQGRYDLDAIGDGGAPTSLVQLLARVVMQDKLSCMPNLNVGHAGMAGGGHAVTPTSGSAKRSRALALGDGSDLQADTPIKKCSAIEDRAVVSDVCVVSADEADSPPPMYADGTKSPAAKPGCLVADLEARVLGRKSIDELTAEVDAAVARRSAAGKSSEKIAKIRRMAAVDAAVHIEEPLAEHDAVDAAFCDEPRKVLRRLTYKQPAPEVVAVPTTPLKPKAKKSKESKKPVAAPAPAPAASGVVKPALSYQPVWYNGGKIYFSKVKGMFRIYRRHGDRLDKKVKCHEGHPCAQARWEKALKLIDDDPRPRIVSPKDHKTLLHVLPA